MNYNQIDNKITEPTANDENFPNNQKQRADENYRRFFSVALLPFYYGGADYRVLLCEPRYSRYNIYRNNGHAYFFAFGRRFPDTDRFAVYVGFRFL